MAPLVEECCSFVAQRTHPCRACRVLAVADRHRCHLLRRDVLLCVLRHFDEAAGLGVDPAVASTASGSLATKKTMGEGRHLSGGGPPTPRATDRDRDRAEAADGFAELPLHLLAEILADDRLSARDESVVFAAAVAWLGHDERREAHADAVLVHVRFPLIDACFLADCVEPHALMQTPVGSKLVHDAYRNLCLPLDRRKVVPRSTAAPRPLSAAAAAAPARAQTTSNAAAPPPPPPPPPAASSPVLSERGSAEHNPFLAPAGHRAAHNFSPGLAPGPLIWHYQ